MIFHDEDGGGAWLIYVGSTINKVYVRFRSRTAAACKRLRGMHVSSEMDAAAALLETASRQATTVRRPVSVLVYVLVVDTSKLYGTIFEDDPTFTARCGWSSLCSRHCGPSC